MTTPKRGLLSLCLSALAACSTTPPPRIEHLPTVCPPVPQCVKPDRKIATNADMAEALLRLDAAFDVCAAARDSLQSCIARAAEIKP